MRIDGEEIREMRLNDKYVVKNEGKEKKENRDLCTSVFSRAAFL